VRHEIVVGVGYNIMSRGESVVEHDLERLVGRRDLIQALERLDTLGCGRDLILGRSRKDLRLIGAYEAVDYGLTQHKAEWRGVLQERLHTLIILTLVDLEFVIGQHTPHNLSGIAYSHLAGEIGSIGIQAIGGLSAVSNVCRRDQFL